MENYFCGLKQDENGRYYFTGPGNLPIFVKEPMILVLAGDTFEAAKGGVRKHLVFLGFQA